MLFYYVYSGNFLIFMGHFYIFPNIFEFFNFPHFQVVLNFLNSMELL